MSRRKPEMTDEELAEWGITPQGLRTQTKSGVLLAKSQGAIPQYPSRQMTILQAQFEQSAPRVLSLGALMDPYQAVGEGTYFPPTDRLDGFSRALPAGLNPNVSVGGVGSATYAACVVQYGAGSSIHRVWMDWQPGNFNLPPCEAVQVDVVPWGAGWASEPDYQFACSVSPGHLAGAHVPTVTGVNVSEIAGAAVVLVPAHARAVDVFCASSEPVGTLRLFGPRQAHIIRDYENNIFLPPWAPVSCTGGDTLQVLWTVPMSWGIRFYLAL
jgi:hypothetical protein